MNEYYVRVLLPAEDFNINDPYYKPYYFRVMVKSKRFVSPVVDRELKRIGLSRKIKRNNNTGMGKADTKIETSPFDNNSVDWGKMDPLYSKEYMEIYLKTVKDKNENSEAV